MRVPDLRKQPGGGGTPGAPQRGLNMGCVPGRYWAVASASSSAAIRLTCKLNEGDDVDRGASEKSIEQGERERGEGFLFFSFQEWSSRDLTSIQSIYKLSIYI